jgi:DNA-binding GntR family transcriptional regulator
LTYRSKKDAVYDTLRRQILDGTLEPGRRLVIDDLASALSVSHIPVREALQQLSAEGFVVSKPYLGSYVSEIRPDSVRELFELLCALEGISARAALTHFTEADLDAFRARLEAMDALVQEPERWSVENVSLHAWLCERGKTPLVATSLARVFVHWDRLRHVYFKEVFAGRVADAQREHWLFYEAFRTRDLSALEAAVRTHNDAATRAYLTHLERTFKPETS